MTLPLAPPAGMRDLLHPESASRRALGRRLGDVFTLYGYELSTTPPFEHAEVLERGLETVDRRDLVRFVEPETGEVALLRPDITPQIARIVATRLRDRPPPFRLCYEGTVVRRRRGRARKHRQIAQAGVELIGVSGAAADVEVISLAVRACEAVGLSRFRAELGQVRIGHAALAKVPEAAREDAGRALAAKDSAELGSVLSEAGVIGSDRDLLVGLVDLYGDVGVIARARSLARDEAMTNALDELAGVVDRLVALGLADRLVVDLGELRGMSYYTGVSFTLLAEGPGEPVGAGGRYDNLLARFDAPLPATGFALDLDNLEWALSRSGAPFAPDLPPRFAIAGDPGACEELTTALRDRGIAAAYLPEADEAAALAFARAWGYDAALFAQPRARRAWRTSDASERPVDPTLAQNEIDALVTWARGS